MNLLDVGIVIGALAAIAGGLRLGLVTRATSWAGMALGLVVAARLAPTALERIDDRDSVQLLLFAALMLMVGALVGQLLGLLAGSCLAARRAEGVLGWADRSLGGAAGLAGVIAAVWLLAPAMTRVESLPAELANQSTITRTVIDHLPEPPNTADLVSDLIGEEEAADIFGDSGVNTAIGDPPVEHGLAPDVLARATKATVRVKGVACARSSEGTGVITSDGLVLTNAHVVAGQVATTVELHDGREVEANVIAFDSTRDLAVMTIEPVDIEGLAIGDPSTTATGDFLDAEGAVLGHPFGGDLDVRPFRIGKRVKATGWDLLYKDKEVERQVYFVAAELERGDSGSALVDQQGNILGLVFAVAPDKRDLAYAVSFREIRAVLDSSRNEPVPGMTGECL